MKCLPTVSNKKNVAFVSDIRVTCCIFMAGPLLCYFYRLSLTQNFKLVFCKHIHCLNLTTWVPRANLDQFTSIFIILCKLSIGENLRNENQ